MKYKSKYKKCWCTAKTDSIVQRFEPGFSLTKGKNEGFETLDFTIRIGSTPTFLYFDLYHYIYYI